MEVPLDPQVGMRTYVHTYVYIYVRKYIKTHDSESRGQEEAGLRDK